MTRVRNRTEETTGDKRKHILLVLFTWGSLRLQTAIDKYSSLCEQCCSSIQPKHSEFQNNNGPIQGGNRNGAGSTS